MAEPGKQEAVITREFDAPREFVFKAFTDSELYAKWLGPRRLTMTIVRSEPRYGGTWRYIQPDRDGHEYASHGVYHEILTPERMISTFEFEGLPEAAHVVLETARFEALPGGRTKLTSQGVYQSVADRDGELRSGMEEGLKESYDRLDELLGQLG